MTDENDLIPLWVDLETTGLDTANDQILEIAAIVSNWEFKPLASIRALISCDEEKLQAMPEFVINMHEESGLLAEVRSYGASLQEAEAHVIDLLESVSQDMDNKKFMLAGSGVSRFDVRFLERDMPDLMGWMGTYRHLDVAPIRSLLIGTGRSDMLPPEGEKENRVHRSFDDAFDHMKEMRFYAEQFRVHY